ncbi:MAG: class I SAM-dependent methyltransferase [Myxococcales bacterium]|nr:class I SAM-dependent methyltransferase [Myxococcales bacterium]
MTSDSDLSELGAFYDASAEEYAQMMDAEIDLPVYHDVLSRLATRIAGLDGAVVDSACGSGHMLARFGTRYDPTRRLVGIDLSDRMVTLTQARIPHGEARIGNMETLASVADASVAGLINFYALHHVPSEEVGRAFSTWARALVSGGQLVVCAWEGEGLIDYGDVTDLRAWRYGVDQLQRWAVRAGFVVDRCALVPVSDFPMDAVLLEATRPPRD